MSRLEGIFAQLRSRREAALVAFLVAGDPEPATSQALLSAVADGGADILEIGLPFSDPLADGKTIQDGCQRALTAGMTPAQVLEQVKELRRGHEIGIVLFSCYNLILQYGLAAFASDAAAAGADGVLVTDLPPEEAADWLSVARAAGLETIFLVAPTTDDARLAQIAAVSSGFLYAVSRMGVTGARTELPADLPDFVGRIRAQGPLPLAVGFGISTPDQVRQVCSVADGAVVGSALVQVAQQGPTALRDFVRSLKQATCSPDK